MRLTLRQRQIIWAYVFMSVALVFFVLIRWYPTILAFNVSFRDWNVFEGSGPWVGFENYQEIWKDAGKPRSSVTAAFSNTVRYVLFGVPSQLVPGAGNRPAPGANPAPRRRLSRRLFRALCDFSRGSRLCLELALSAGDRAAQSGVGPGRATAAALHQESATGFAFDHSGPPCGRTWALQSSFF